MEGLTEVVWFHYFVPGSGEGAQKTLPSLVPDFWISSHNSFVTNFKESDILPHLQANT